MNYVGIDMSKDTFHAALSESEVVVFKNNHEGIKKFIETLKKRQYARFDTNVGTEATGVYHLLLCESLRSDGWNIKVINPLITHRMIDSTLRRLKTDKHDALAIQKTLLTGAGYLYTDTPEILALKSLVRERETLSRMKAETRQRIEAHGIRERAAGIDFHDSLTGTLKFLSYEIKEIEKMMGKYVPETQKLLRSIPGVG